MLAYHVARLSNLASIQQRGLEPRIGELSQLLGEPVPRVYLFSTYREAEIGLLNWLGEEYEELEEACGHAIPLAILEVDLSGIVDEHASDFFEIAVEEVIPASRIQRTFSEKAFSYFCLSQNQALAGRVSISTLGV